MADRLPLIPLNDVDPLHSYLDEQGAALTSIGPLASINMFVGANNSGKSRLLRRIFKMRQKHQLCRDPAWLKELFAAIEAVRGFRLIFMDDKARIDVNAHPKDSSDIVGGDEQLKSLRPGGRAWMLNRQVVDGYIYGLVERPIPGRQAIDSDTRAQLGFLDKLLRFDKPPASTWTYGGEVARSELSNRLGNLIAALDQLSAKLPDFQAPCETVYIPTLRTTLTLRQNQEGQRLQQDVYLDAVVFHYDLKDYRDQIFTGMGYYERVQKQEGAPKAERREKEQFAAFLSKAFFGGVPLEVVASTDGQQLSLAFGEGEDRPIHHMGDGVAALIVLTYKIFTAAAGSWLFIEEPETHLHPGLQRVLIEVLLHHEAIRAKGLRTFITTHSSHLLGMALHERDNVSVFAFERRRNEDAFVVRAMLGPELRVLEDLGVENSSVFLANCTIWVEGPTDRKYLRAYLAAYCKHHNLTFQPLEDLHYAFFEYAGTNLAHYAFDDSSDEGNSIRATFLSNRIFLLADRDRDKSGKHSELLHQQHPGFVYEVTTTVEIDNLLSARFLRESVFPKLTKLPPPQREFVEADYTNVRLGDFLKDLCGAPDTFVAEGGTLKTYYKNRLADLAVSKMTWELMSPAARELTTRLYNFIQLHNFGRKSSQ